MNVNLVLKVGFKVLAAVFAGAAIVIGVDRAVGRESKSQNNQQPGGGGEKNPMIPAGGNEINSVNSCSQQTCGGGYSNPGPQTKSDIILSGIRAAGDTCGKLFTFAQAVGSVIESASRVFGDGPSQPAYYSPGSNSYTTQAQAFQSGNITWVPVNGSSCILQAVPNPQQKW